MVTRFDRWQRIGMMAAVLCAVASTAPATADTQAMQFVDSGNRAGFYNFTCGWDFTVSQSVRVTQLGLWDDGANGLAESHKVTIWDAGGAVLTSDIVSSTGAGQDWHWKELADGSQVVLVPGVTYTIGGYDSAAADFMASYATKLDPAPQVSWLVGRMAFGDARPFIDNNFGYSLFGPNFKFKDPDPVPESALIQLPILLGMGGAGYWWRRRRAG